MTTAFFGSMLKGSDFVRSNVPGSPFPLYVAGAELERLYPFAPLSGTTANIALLSHCGTCCIGIDTDAVAIPDTADFVKVDRSRVRRGARARLIHSFRDL